MGPQQCGVCRDAQSKYKCPTCLVRYCSLTCFKKHKEVPCLKVEPPKQDSSPLQRPPRSFENNEDEYGWRLRRSQLEALVASGEIRQILKDQELQRLIIKIDSSSNAEQDLTKAMEEPLFLEFTDKLLAVLNPKQQPCFQI